MSETTPGTILIVDDDREIVELFNEMVEAVGPYRILKAGSGTEALTVIESEHPDLLLMDIMMEGMDGIELCTIIRADPTLNDISVIAVTVINPKETEKYNAIINAGVDAYLKKPFGISDLKAIIESHIGKRSATESPD